VQNSQSEPARSLQSKSRCRTDQTVPGRLADQRVTPIIQSRFRAVIDVTDERILVRG
jgi:hypothetical protein